MSSKVSFSVLLPSFLLLLSFSFNAEADVPVSDTFTFVNEGEFGPYIVEYDGNYRVLSIANSPFQLCFYNTTPNAFTLALRMGTLRSESLFRWVWEANRGNPVGENATLKFKTDGNLVLVDADGRVAWQTNTANKGVVGFKLLPNGNMVLYDAKGNFIWQSFDYPTDTLLVGQALRAKSPTKLVSRLSDQVNLDGPYSLVLEPNTLALYYKTSNTPRPILYYPYSGVFSSTLGNLESVTFSSAPEDEEANAYELQFVPKYVKSDNGGTIIVARPKYNSTLSMLRLGSDGNLRIYTFYDKVSWGAWEVTYTLFSRVGESECQLPERCGNFGLFEDNQCVACPLPNGLVGWSKDCTAEKVSSCRASDFHYYKLEGVDHFMSTYTKGDGPISVGECENKCTKDCKCLGYFYHSSESRCWTAYELKTLTRVANQTHLGYIKTPGH
ncbi:Bulb-type lectin domain [Dillenia turbinata]|uniref:Bulb-type lectin domain n=1 Tax=Dillenia turbinata TaxID=194707 RepID=A0AAN8WHK2_9MAGN